MLICFVILVPLTWPPVPCIGNCCNGRGSDEFSTTQVTKCWLILSCNKSWFLITCASVLLGVLSALVTLYHLLQNTIGGYLCDLFFWWWSLLNHKRSCQILRFILVSGILFRNQQQHTQWFCLGTKYVSTRWNSRQMKSKRDIYHFTFFIVCLFICLRAEILNQITESYL